MLIFVSGSGKYWPQNPELVSSGKCPSGHSLLAIAVLYCYLRSVGNLSLSTLLLKEIPCYVKFCLLLGFYRYINQSLAQFSEELLWIFYHFCYVFSRCTLPLTKQIDDAEVIKLTMSLQRTDLPNIEKSIEEGSVEMTANDSGKAAHLWMNFCLCSIYANSDRFQSVAFQISVMCAFIAPFLQEVEKCTYTQHAVELQSNCVRRTCSRSLHSNCLGRGANPYSPQPSSN